MRVRCEGCGEEFASTDDAIVHVEDYPATARCTYDNMSEVFSPMEAYNEEFRWLDRKLVSMSWAKARAVLQLVQEGREYLKTCEANQDGIPREMPYYLADFVRYLLEEADLL